jgi:hypothetical protein
MKGVLNSISPIKSIQRGSGSNSSNKEIAININPVNIDKSVILVNSKAKGNVYYEFYDAVFKSSSIIKLIRRDEGLCDYSWQVIEFN